MNIEYTHQSQDLNKSQRLIEIGSHSSRSEKFSSASRSLKAFEGSLRKQDSNNRKSQDFNSPLKKRLAFGKTDHVQSKQKEKTFYVDTLKKIKKVESPFQQKPSVEVFSEKIQASEKNLLISCFDSISEKIEDQSSIEQEKSRSPMKRIEMDIENLQVYEAIECEQNHSKVQLEQPPKQEGQFQQPKESLIDIENSASIQPQKYQELIANLRRQNQSEDLMQNSSQSSSDQNKSSSSIRSKKKESKIKKRKEKKKMAKSMKIKLRNITNFVEELHRKVVHTDRKEVHSELSQHLWERKFSRLRKQLKRLI